MSQLNMMLDDDFERGDHDGARIELELCIMPPYDRVN